MLTTPRPLTFATALLATALLGPTLATPAQAKEVIKYAYLLDPAQDGILYALREGIVSSDSIEVQTTALAIPALIQATPTKQYDVLMTAVMAVPLAARRGLHLQVLSAGITAAPGRKGGGVWVKQDSPLQSVTELEGKTIGNYALNSTGTTWLRAALAGKYGLDVAYENGDMQWVQIPAPALPAALASERIDAATLIHSQAYQAEQTGDFRLLANTTQDIHDLFGIDSLSAVLVSYPDKLAARPEAFKEFNRLLRASVDYAVANPHEVGAAIAEDGKISADYFTAWLADYSRTPGYIDDSHLRAMEIIWREAEKLGLLNAGDAPSAAAVVWEHAPRGN